MSSYHYCNLLHHTNRDKPSLDQDVKLCFYIFLHVSCVLDNSMFIRRSALHAIQVFLRGLTLPDTPQSDLLATL